MKKLTEQETALVAAVEMNKSFSKEDFIVGCWNKDRRFGLRNYDQQYPDSNRVVCCLYGKKGLLAKGWIKKVEEGKYETTESGKEQAKKVLVKDKNLTDLTKDEFSFLSWTEITQAVHKWRTGDKQEIIFEDALDFWGCHDRTDRQTLLNRIEYTKKEINVLHKKLEKNNAVDKRNGRAFGLSDIILFGETHNWLLVKFNSQIQRKK